MSNPSESGYWDASTGEALSDAELYERYDDMLDSTYPAYEIMGMTMTPSRILKEVDPTCYTGEFHNWTDWEEKEGNLTDEEPEDES